MYSPRLRILRAKTLHIAPLNDYLAFVWICLAWVEVLIQASEREVCVCVQTESFTRHCGEHLHLGAGSCISRSALRRRGN